MDLVSLKKCYESGCLNPLIIDVFPDFCFVEQYLSMDVHLLNFNDANFKSNSIFTNWRYDFLFSKIVGDNWVSILSIDMKDFESFVISSCSFQQIVVDNSDLFLKMIQYCRFMVNLDDDLTFFLAGFDAEKYYKMFCSYQGRDLLFNYRDVILNEILKKPQFSMVSNGNS